MSGGVVSATAFGYKLCVRTPCATNKPSTGRTKANLSIAKHLQKSSASPVLANEKRKRNPSVMVSTSTKRLGSLTPGSPAGRLLPQHGVRRSATCRTNWTVPPHDKKRCRKPGSNRSETVLARPTCTSTISRWIPWAALAKKSFAKPFKRNFSRECFSWRDCADGSLCLSAVTADKEDTPRRRSASTSACNICAGGPTSQQANISAAGGSSVNARRAQH
mmetsp:Transcript_83810/g.242362  ORF Transcript_83810/g.242362 Transcript_83810/m.242362 type:complete len:219 (+) Transcript_83810:164-820(+)